MDDPDRQSVHPHCAAALRGRFDLDRLADHKAGRPALQAGCFYTRFSCGGICFFIQIYGKMYLPVPTVGEMDVAADRLALENTSMVETDHRLFPKKIRLDLG